MRTRIFFSVNNTDYLLHTDSHGFFFFVPNFRIIEFCLHTEYRGRSRIFFFFSCPELSNFRILSSHGISRTVTDFLFCHEFSFFLSRIIELSNFNHTEYRGQSRVSFLSRIIELSNFIFLVPRLSLVPRLVLGPTDRREVIFELSNFCLP